MGEHLYLSDILSQTFSENMRVNKIIEIHSCLSRKKKKKKKKTTKGLFRGIFCITLLRNINVFSDNSKGQQLYLSGSLSQAHKNMVADTHVIKRQLFFLLKISFFWQHFYLAV